MIRQSVKSERPDKHRDVFVRNTSLVWPSGPESAWSVWCNGSQLYSHRDRDSAITRARAEAASRQVAVWLGEPGPLADPL